MGIFSSILDKIRHHASADSGAQGGQMSGQAGQSNQSSTSQPSSQMQQAGTPQASGAQGGGQQQGMQQQPVDVEAVLSKLASEHGGGGNWRTSIVDLLKLLDLDSSLAARKTLAQELDVHAGADGSAEQNIALQKAVMRKIAENGGKVPDSLKH